MDGPAADLIARAESEFGCTETTIEGLESDDAATLACDIEGRSYVLEIARELDRYGSSPGLEVGLYQH